MGDISGIIAALGATSLWAFAICLLDEPLKRFGPIVCNFFKATFVAGLYWLTIAVLVLTGRSGAPSFSVKDVLMLLASGLIGMAFGDSAFLEAMKRAGARQTTLLHATAPIFLLIAPLVTGKDVLDFRELSGVGLVLAGVAYVIVHQRRSAEARSTDFWGGVFWGVMSAVGQAAGILLSREAMTRSPVLAASGVRLIGASAGLLIGCAFFGRARPLLRAMGDRALWRLATIPAFFGTYIGILLMMVAVKSTKAAAAGALLSTTPLFVVPLSTLIARQRFDLRLFGGIAVAVAGIICLSLVDPGTFDWRWIAAAAAVLLVVTVLFETRKSAAHASRPDAD